MTLKLKHVPSLHLAQRRNKTPVTYYLGNKEKEDIPSQNLYESSKKIPRRKFITLNAYTIKVGR